MFHIYKWPYAMATKNKKTQVRIDPIIAKALGIIAKAEGKPAYEILELICVDWIVKNKPEYLILIEECICQSYNTVTTKTGIN